MVNVELVITIPEEDYRKISNSNPSYGGDFNLYYAVKNGTPLPKGHGRLIDADALDKDCESSEYHEVVASWLDLAQTIIEAERSEDKKC